MKKFIITIIIALCAFTANAQKLHFGIGADYAFDPNIGRYNEVSCVGHQYGINASVATELTNNVYAGIGVGVDNYQLVAKSYGLSISDNMMLFPLYLDVYHVAANKLFFEAKFGAAFERYEGEGDTALYLSIVPIGYTLGNISLGLGYRCIAEDDYNINGVTVTAKYTF